MVNPRCRCLDLTSFLLEPMQRITRYPLLLRQVVHYTPNNHPDHTSVLKALELTEVAVEKVNEAARETENQAKTIEIIKTVDFEGLDEVRWLFGIQIGIKLMSEHKKLDLYAPTRHLGRRQFILEGELVKVKNGKKMRAFLFNDLLILTQKHPSSSRGLLHIVYRKV